MPKRIKVFFEEYLLVTLDNIPKREANTIKKQNPK